MKTSQFRNSKLFLIVIFSVFAASLDISKSHPSKPINILRTFEKSRPWNNGPAMRLLLRPGRSFQTEEEISDTRSEAASGMWFGPRLGRSPSGQQKYDTVTWIALDDPSRILQAEDGRPRLGFNWKSVEGERKLRSPQETEENFPSNAMWFGPRVGRNFPRFNVSYSLEDMKAKDGSDGYYE